MRWRPSSASPCDESGLAMGEPHDPLTRLAREGGRRLARAARKRGRRQWFSRAQEPTAAEHVARAVFGETGLASGAVLLLVFAPVAIGGLWGWWRHSEGAGLVAAFLATALSGAAMVSMQRPWSKRLVERERAAVAALPFEVRGWFEKAP
ncbi:MAG: hypothetical protein IAE78_07470 [Myxococcus sp.]|nr:hypothetical protein [Myxococcus sp.]